VAGVLDVHRPQQISDRESSEAHVARLDDLKARPALPQAPPAVDDRALLVSAKCDDPPRFSVQLEDCPIECPRRPRRAFTLSLRRFNGCPVWCVHPRRQLDHVPWPSPSPKRPHLIEVARSMVPLVGELLAGLGNGAEGAGLRNDSVASSR